MDMLTSRCRTLRGLDSVRRSPAAASCSRETERERERDCDREASRLCLVLQLSATAFACESKSIGGSGCRWTSSSSSASDSESDEDVHCGIRNSFLRKSLYCSGSFSENLNDGGRFESSCSYTCVTVTHAGCTTSSQNVCIQSRRGLVPSMFASAVSASGSAICQSTSRSMSPSSRSSRMLRGVDSSSSSEDCCTLRLF